VAESVWDDNEELISSMREDIGTPFTFQYWEFLVKEFKKRKIALGKEQIVSTLAKRAIALAVLFSFWLSWQDRHFNSFK
jgi:hypothetical protein